MEKMTGFPNEVCGEVILAMENAGVFIVKRRDGFYADDPNKAMFILQSHDPVPSLVVDKVARVKEEAARRIDRVAPLWRQLNMVREMAAIAFVNELQRTQQMRERFIFLRNFLQKLDDVRAASDVIESRISAETDWKTLERMDVKSAPEWPQE